MTSEEDIKGDNSFMFMDIYVQGLKVTALLDSGSSVNVITKTLFDTLPILRLRLFIGISKQN